MSLLVEDVIESDAMAATKRALSRVQMLPNPFTPERVEKHVDTGQTLYEMMGAVGCKPGRSYLVFLQGEWVPPERWKQIRPKPHAEVVIKAVPMSGDDGDQNKTLRTILQVVIIIVAVVASYYIGPWAGMLISVGGNLALAALLPPKFATPKTPGREEPGFSITGSRNTANPGGPIPRVYGRHRMFPLYGARPFTEIVGEKQYLRMLFTCGYGPLQISALKIGETPIEEFVGVEVEIREGGPSDAPLTLFANTPFEENPNILLQHTRPVVRTTEPNTDEISVDFIFPAGLFDVGERDRENKSVTWVTEYSPAGANTWTARPGQNETRNTSTPIRRGDRWIVTRGQYDVRVTRLSPPAGSANASDELFWSALRSVKYIDPIPDPRMSKIVVRIRATEQLNGVIDTLSCLVEAKLPTWNGTAWTTGATVTRNPAAAYLDILTGIANKRPVATSRIDLAGLGAWYTACASAGRNYDAVIDYRTTVFESLHEVAVAGRAAFGMPDGKYGVVRDILQTTPVQMFTPRNSWGFTGRRVYLDPIDGFRMPFIDETNNYQAGELLVHNDGIDAEAATTYEVLQLPGITNPDALWKEGRYHLAAAKLRPEVWEFNTDVENIVCQRGDLVKIQHDVLLVGLSSGRVKDVHMNVAGTVALGATLDERVTMEAGRNYGIRFRHADGTFVHRQVVTVAGEDQRDVTFTTGISTTSPLARGDLFAFSELGLETVDALVKAIFPGPDLTARLECVPAAPDVHDADAGPIPPYNPGITIPPHLRIPPTPRVDAVVTDKFIAGVGGDKSSRVIILWAFIGGEGLDGARLEASWRDFTAPDTTPWVVVDPIINMDAMTLDIAPLTPGTTVDVRLRAVSRYGIPSAWVTVTHIALPSPPKHTSYTLTPITGGYRAARFRQTGPAPPPRVKGLRLLNGAAGNNNDTLFKTETAKFKWNAQSLSPGLGDGEDDLALDPEVSYRVQISSGSVVRHTANPTTNTFDYTLALNTDDHAGTPARAFTIRVWLRTSSGLDGTPAILRVSNPEPSMAGFTPTAVQRPGGVLVGWAGYAWTDSPDREKFDVYVDAENEYPVNLKATVSDKQRSALIPDQPPGAVLRVRVVPHDVFGPGVSSEVLEFSTKPSTPSGITARARPSGITLRYGRIPDPDFDSVEVWRNDTTDLDTAVLIGHGNRTSYVDTSEDLVDGTRYSYWLRVRTANDAVGDFSGRVNSRMPYAVGYQRVGGGTAIALGKIGSLAAAVDTVNNEIDIIQTDGGATRNVFWAEATLTGNERTPFGATAKFTGTYSRVDAVFNDTALHVALTNNGDSIEYGRLSKDGTVQQVGVAKFTGEGVGIACRFDTLYWAFINNHNVMFATTSLTGTILHAATSLGNISFLGAKVTGPARVRLDVDSSQNAHIFFTVETADGYEFWRAKCSPTGAVLIPPTRILLSPVNELRSVGVHVNISDQVFALVAEVDGSVNAGLFLKMTRYSGMGVLRSPLRPIFAAKDIKFAMTLAADRRDDDLFIVWGAAGDEIKVEQFARIHG
jgi:hypothetical protein